MGENYTFIYVHRYKFELRPCPTVTVGFEPLIIVINWDDNVGGEWTDVHVQNFTRDNASLDSVLNSQSHPTFKHDPSNPTRPDPDQPNMNFVTFPSTPPLDDRCYKYELVFHRRNGEVFTVDPTLMIRRVGM
jgi:hypothetical protein